MQPKEVCETATEAYITPESNVIVQIDVQSAHMGMFVVPQNEVTGTYVG